jgi:hypothetical protein
MKGGRRSLWENALTEQPKGDTSAVSAESDASEGIYCVPVMALASHEVRGGFNRSETSRLKVGTPLSLSEEIDVDKLATTHLRIPAAVKEQVGVHSAERHRSHQLSSRPKYTADVR